MNINSIRLGQFGNLAKNIITPSIGLGNMNLLYMMGMIDEDAKRWNRMEQGIRDAGIKSQADFDWLYDSYRGNPHMRGYVGRIFPEYYQDYIRRH